MIVALTLSLRVTKSASESKTERVPWKSKSELRITNYELIWQVAEYYF